MAALFAVSSAHENTVDHAEIVIYTFRRAGLSADDRRIAMLKSAFSAFSVFASRFCDLRNVA